MLRLLCGKNTVLESIKNKALIKKIYVTKENIFLLKEHNFEFVCLTKLELDKLTNFANHQGIAAEIIDFNYYDFGMILKDKPSKIIVLDHIQDQNNLGAVLRTLNAAGWNYLIIPKDRSASITSSTLKISSGGYFGLKIIRVSSLYDAIINLKKIGYWVYSTTLDDNSKDYKSVKFLDPKIIIFGNEKTGVSKTLLKISDEKIHIPMFGSVQSLNVSVSVGIILFNLENN